MVVTFLDVDGLADAMAVSVTTGEATAEDVATTVAFTLATATETVGDATTSTTLGTALSTAATVEFVSVCAVTRATKTLQIIITKRQPRDNLETERVLDRALGF